MLEKACIMRFCFAKNGSNRSFTAETPPGHKCDAESSSNSPARVDPDRDKSTALPSKGRPF